MDEEFAARGWAILRQAVTPERVAALLAECDAALAEAAFPDGVAGLVWEIPNVARGRAALSAYLHDGEIAARVAALVGWRRVQLLQDTLLYKPPRVGGRVEWHQDYSYLGYLDPPRSVSVRLALTDCNVESGCMNVLDGARDLVGDVRALTATRVDQVLPVGSIGTPVALELAPGDVSVHHCLTFHGSLENRSERGRKTLILRVFDGDCRVIVERLPAHARALFPVTPDGRLSESAFPVLYQRP